MAEKKTISAREVVADIMVGLTDEQLMEKHMLSAKGLESLKNKLLSAGLITQSQLDRKSPAKVTPQVDKRALAKNIADAIKSGLPDNEISKRFGMSPSKLTAVYNSLIKAGYLALDDLTKRPGKFEETVDLVENNKIAKTPQKETSSQANETTNDVLRDFGKRFNIPTEDLERLKNASIKEIKEFFDKHKIPISEGKELIKALGLKVGDFLFEKVGKLKEIAQGMMSKPETPAAAPVEETHPAPSLNNDAEKDQEPRKVRKCPNCKMPQEEEFEICPQCGVVVGKYLEKIESEEPKKKKRSLLVRVVGWMAACIGGFFVLLFIMGLLAGSKEDKTTAKIDDSPKAASSKASSTKISYAELKSGYIEELCTCNKTDADEFKCDAAKMGVILLFFGTEEDIKQANVFFTDETFPPTRDRVIRHLQEKIFGKRRCEEVIKWTDKALQDILDNKSREGEREFYNKTVYLSKAPLDQSKMIVLAIRNSDYKRDLKAAGKQQAPVTQPVQPQAQSGESCLEQCKRKILPSYHGVPVTPRVEKEIEALFELCLRQCGK
jgi:hypothetical protein